MTLTLPESAREQLEAKAKRFGFTSVEDYILDLVEHDDDYELPTNPSTPTFRTREEFAVLIQEGINSGGAIPVDEDFWEERRRILREKIAKRNGTSP